MATRIAGAILGLLIGATAAHAQTEVLIPAPLVDSAEQPTSMPDECSQRDVSCVLEDGAPHRVVIGASEHTPPRTAIPATGPAVGTSAGSAAIGGATGATTGSGSAGVAGRR